MPGLGDYIPNLSGKALPWGPDGQWSVWMAGGVVEGLVELLDLHLHLPERIHDPPPEDSPILFGDQQIVHDPRSAVIGVVPWLTHQGVLDRFEQMSSLIIVDKGQTSTSGLQALQKRGQPFPFDALPTTDRRPSWEDYAPVDDEGQPAVIGPGSDWPPGPGVIGPIRVAGFKASTPLVHTKLLVFGTLAWFKNYAWPEGGPGEYQTFTPRFVWWGSANWTQTSGFHLEMGVACDDEAIMSHALTFLSDLIEISEPLGSKASKPTPELASVDFDDEAILDYLAEYGWWPPDFDDNDD